MSDDLPLSMPYGEVPVTVTERGAARPVLLLHGGGGPDSFAGFADQLAGAVPVRVLTPVNPGFGGTPRPDWLDSIRGLAEVYARLLAELDLAGVTVAGNSIGGWVAAELALAAPDRVARWGIDGAGLVSPTTRRRTSSRSRRTSSRSFLGRSGGVPYRPRLDDRRAARDLRPQPGRAGGLRRPVDGRPGPGRAAVRHHGRHAGGLGGGGPDGHPRVRQGVRGRDPGRDFRVLPRAGHLPQLETPEAALALFAQA